ncbi:MAG: DUF5680 domain-containing protein [Nanoarchaeota archaeon]
MGRERFTVWPNLVSRHIRIWGMNYSDNFWLPKDFPNSEIVSFKEEVMGFLKEALMQVPVDYPFRGPIEELTKEVGDRKLIYINVPRTNYKRKEDAFREFEGHEVIRVVEPKGNGARVYNAFTLVYHGGLLVPDSYIKK